MLEDLGSLAIALARHGPDLFEQRQITVGLDVTGDARVAIPVPGPADIAALLDDSQVLDPLLAKTRTGQESTEATADQHHVDLFRDGRSLDVALDPGVAVEMRVDSVELEILAVGVVAKSLLPLLAILRLQGGEVESSLRLRPPGSGI